MDPYSFYDLNIMRETDPELMAEAERPSEYPQFYINPADRRNRSITVRQSALKRRELIIELKERSLAERNAALECREVAIELEESRLDDRRSALDRREDAIELKEKEAHSRVMEEMKEKAAALEQVQTLDRKEGSR